jgi:hypothetical protein
MSQLSGLTQVQCRKKVETWANDDEPTPPKMNPPAEDAWWLLRSTPLNTLSAGDDFRRIRCFLASRSAGRHARHAGTWKWRDGISMVVELCHLLSAIPLKSTKRLRHIDGMPTVILEVRVGLFVEVLSWRWVIHHFANDFFTDQIYGPWFESKLRFGNPKPWAIHCIHLGGKCPLFQRWRSEMRETVGRCQQQR